MPPACARMQVWGFWARRVTRESRRPARPVSAFPWSLGCLWYPWFARCSGPGGEAWVPYTEATGGDVGPAAEDLHVPRGQRAVLPTPALRHGEGSGTGWDRGTWPASLGQGFLLIRTRQGQPAGGIHVGGGAWRALIRAADGGAVPSCRLS